ncbi:MAG: class I SAM-dependent methyltransferase, partial [Elusimicrobiales bacterium]|nr:class I SAM-dependent methyltransferase [Elusimicrobiales bacterium]
MTKNILQAKKFWKVKAPNYPLPFDKKTLPKTKRILKKIREENIIFKDKIILDIGCGTGISLEPLLDKGVYLTGLDPSLYMLDLASKRLGNKVDLHRGSAEDLPFEDNAFDSAILFTSLEFTDRPAKAIEEACRVAKDTVIICVLNRYAPLNMVRRVKSFFVPNLFTHANFFSIWELKQIIRSLLGNVPISWRTVCQIPA